MILESFIDTKYDDIFEEEDIDLYTTFAHYFDYNKVLGIYDKQSFVEKFLYELKRILHSQLQ
jgi:hypothetical protein